jgi:hypothetical protein
LQGRLAELQSRQGSPTEEAGDHNEIREVEAKIAKMQSQNEQYPHVAVIAASAVNKAYSFLGNLFPSKKE